jgi:predicted nuclease of predicted toxin-antitoxin system
MKLLLDQGLPPLTAELLRRQGIDAIYVSEIGWARAEDTKIIELAQANDRIIVTLDADYHAAIALTSSPSPSVIWIRVVNLRASEYVEIIMPILNEYKEMLINGILITIRSDRQVKTRLLPIILDTL